MTGTSSVVYMPYNLGGLYESIQTRTPRLPNQYSLFANQEWDPAEGLEPSKSGFAIRRLGTSASPGENGAGTFGQCPRHLHLVSHVVPVRADEDIYRHLRYQLACANWTAPLCLYRRPSTAEYNLGAPRRIRTSTPIAEPEGLSLLCLPFHQQRENESVCYRYTNVCGIEPLFRNWSGLSRVRRHLTGLPARVTLITSSR
jgi:hypothetical protein